MASFPRLLLAAPHRLPFLSGSLGLGVIAYFATLWTLGFRLNDFKRRAN